ncbi:MAG: hypothetical protein V1866_02695 [archaeon]
MQTDSCCSAGTVGAPEICTNHIDDDADCKIDCDDSDCSAIAYCQQQATHFVSASGCPLDYWVNPTDLDKFCSGECDDYAADGIYRKEYNFLTPTTAPKKVESAKGNNVWQGVCLAFPGAVSFDETSEYNEDVGVTLMTDIRNIEADMIGNEGGLDNINIPEEFTQEEICPGDSNGKCTDTCSEDGTSVYKFFYDGAEFPNEDDVVFFHAECPNNNKCVKDDNRKLPGARCYVCDHDAICDEFEQPEGCADCRLCDDVGRIIYNNPTGTDNKPENSASIDWSATTKACQGTNPDSFQSCMFCPEPAQSPTTDSYSYTFPNELFVSKDATKRFACVNVTVNPLNCGKCGFTDAGATVNTGNDAPVQGVCYGSKPYCVDRNCLSGVLDEAKKKQVEDYLTSHQDANPMLYYDVVPYRYGYKSVPLDGSVVDTAYTVSQQDSSALACSYSQGGGSKWEADLGCCGDSKCRIKSGTMCHVTNLCDGTEWHEGANEDTNGEVFKMGDNCDTPFPVANINGEFMKCIDYDKMIPKSTDSIPPNTFPLKFTSDGYGCFDPSNPIYSNVSTNESKLSTEAWEYLCPEGSYMIQPMGGTRGMGYDATGEEAETCKAHPNQPEDYRAGGKLVCAASGPALANDIYGFASIIDSASDPIWKFTQSPTFMSNPFCPASVYTTPTREVLAMTPCPGIVSYESFEPLNPAVALTGMGDNARIAVVCSSTKTDAHPAVGMSNDPAEGMSELGYFKGEGIIMGKVKDRDYACFTDLSVRPTDEHDNTRAFIGVCCGTQTCAGIEYYISQDGGKMYTPGQSVNTTRGLVYCLEDGSWAADMDFPDTQSACSAAKFLATGNFCCSEWDDNTTAVKESYSDVNGSGACFKSTPQKNGKFLKYNVTSYQSVLVYNGSLRGCGFEDSLYASAAARQASCSWKGLISNDCLQGVEDWPNPGGGDIIRETSQTNTRTSTPAIKQAEACTLIADVDNGYYCNTTGSWVDAVGENISHLSTVPQALMVYLRKETGNQNLVNIGCCLPTQCWDPKANVCIDTQASFDLFYKVDNATIFKCWSGEWINVLGGEKYTPDGCVSGFCPEKSMCLLNPSGNPADNGNTSGNPQCILSGQYVGDRLCVNGGWSTRTAVVSLKLASLIKASDDFTLSCGDTSDVLFNKLNPGLTNSYCVLNLNGKRIFGTSLNQNLTGAAGSGFVAAMSQSFWLSYPGSSATFDDSACSSSLTGFNRCIHATAGSKKELLNLYYDKNYSIVIFSNQPVSGLTPGVIDKICSSLPGWLKWLCPTPSSLADDLKRSDFDRAFAAKQGSKQTLGLGKNKCDGIRKSWIYSFNYTGFGVNGLDRIIEGFGKEAVVKKLGNGISVVITNPTSASAWNDLSVLRSLIV